MRLKPQMYRIKIRGEEIARGELMLGRYLAIPGATVDENLQGIKTIEPAFGLPSIWITDVERSHAELMGYTVVAPDIRSEYPPDGGGPHACIRSAFPPACPPR